MTDTDMTTRLELLESKLMHQEASIEELTRTLLAQEQRINAQSLAIERLEDMLRNISEAGPVAADKEPLPPHY